MKQNKRKRKINWNLICPGCMKCIRKLGGKRMAKFHKGEDVAFKVNPMGNGEVMGAGKVVSCGDRVSNIVVLTVQKTPYLRTGQGLTLANTMIYSLSTLQLNDSSSIIGVK